MMVDPHPSDPKLRDVAAVLAQAGDAQIARVVAMVDRMPDRGEADGLIAPLRQRLAQLRPKRPFGFTRLLFSPLDPVIIPGTRWRRGEIGIPRPALAPLGMAVQAALPELNQALEPSACRVSPDDRRAIAGLGAGLWPHAAAALRTIPVPENWTAASGLVANDFNNLVPVIAAVLQEAAEIETLGVGRDIPSDSIIRAILARVAPQTPLALPTTVAVLLARMPVPARVLALASETPTEGRNVAADRAMDHTLACLQSAMVDGGADNRDMMEVAVEAARIAALLVGLEEGGAMSGERRRQVEQIRREADGLCRRRFDRAAAAALLQASATVTIEYDDEAFTALENAGRDLRRLEAAGRRLGSADHYAALIHTVANQFRDHKNGLGLVDRVRMVEILSGPEAALELMLSQQA